MRLYIDLAENHLLAERLLHKRFGRSMILGQRGSASGKSFPLPDGPHVYAIIKFYHFQYQIDTAITGFGCEGFSAQGGRVGYSIF